MMLTSIILFKKSFGEGHCLLSLLTKQKGLLKVYAFGGKKMSKRFKGGLDFFNIIEAEIEETKNEYNNLVSIKELVYKFKNIPNNINKYVSACYILELSSIVLIHNELAGKSNKNYFDFVSDFLHKLENSDADYDMFNIVFDFQITLLQETGFLSAYIAGSTLKEKFFQLEQINVDLINKIPKSFLMLKKLTHQL